MLRGRLVLHALVNRKEKWSKKRKSWSSEIENEHVIFMRYIVLINGDLLFG